MPKVTTDDGEDLHYRDDCFAAPWESPPAMLLLHAEGENGLAWFGWMPRLGARRRVLRPDMRGAGDSAPMRPGQPWSLDQLVEDVLMLLDAVEVETVDVVAARFGGTLAMRLAAAHPNRVSSLALCSATPQPAVDYGVRAAGWAQDIERGSIDAWAVDAAQDRFGPDAEEATLEGWAGLLAESDPASLLSLFRNLPMLDVSGDLARITCPTLVVTTDASPTLPLDATTRWQRRIARSELLVLTGRGDHVAATHDREVAGAVLDFQRKAAKEGGGGRRKERDREGARAEKRQAREDASGGGGEKRKDKGARRQERAALRAGGGGGGAGR